jgi:nucleotide sugar dehydrogenase
MQAAQKYKIGVVGTGVVGSGILKAWVTRGYNVVGYDVNHETIELLNIEGYTVQHLNKFHHSDADVIFICISTPQSDDGSIFLDYLLNGIEVVGDWIEKRVQAGHYPMIVMRSTMLPNLSRNLIIPALNEASACIAGQDFGYAHLPEILRETDAFHDSLNLWQVVIGELDKRTGDVLEEMFTPVLGVDKDKLLSRVPVSVAEAAKVLLNSFNATIISYYNMMGLLLNTLDIDAQAAIDLSVRMGEGSLNSWYGTRTGMPYGGKCLPKDVAALLAMARAAQENGLDVPMHQLQATQDINDAMLQLANQGKAPAPIKAGFRRLSADGMRKRTIELYDAYHSMNNTSVPTEAVTQEAKKVTVAQTS